MESVDGNTIVDGTAVRLLVALLMESVDGNVEAAFRQLWRKVALLMESVDGNALILNSGLPLGPVALLMESVDGNCSPEVKSALDVRRSPHGERGLKLTYPFLLFSGRVALLMESVDGNRFSWASIFVMSVALLMESVDGNATPVCVALGIRVSLSSWRAWIEIAP